MPVPAFEPRAMLLELIAAHDSGDTGSLSALVEKARQIVDRVHEDVLVELPLNDWTVEAFGEPGEDVVPGQATGGRLIVRISPTGLWVDAMAPGTGEIHSVAMEFDRDALALNVYKAEDEGVQARVHVDGRGAHVSDGLNDSTSTLFRGRHGSYGCGDWEPDQSLAPTIRA